MKYALVIADGAADVPLEALAGRTPLEAASTPNLDRLAARGRVGLCHTTPRGFEAGSDVCCMSLLGYDPLVDHTGRAPIEAAAMGLALRPGDWIFRVNLVTVSDEPRGGAPARGRQAQAGLMLDHSAGGLPDAEARVLFADLLAHWRRHAPDIAPALELHHGKSYRGIAIDRGGLAFGDVDTTPPHEIPGRPWAEHLPDGGEPGAAAHLNRLNALSHDMLAQHEINRARVDAGLRPANMAWIWGQGTAARLQPFRERFGVAGAITTAVDLLKGLGHLVSWEPLEVPGAASYHASNDYAAQARACIDALDRVDLVCCHVETPDEAGHQADAETKLAAIEAIDREVIGPLLAKLESFGDSEEDAGYARGKQGWRMLVLPDHYTRCDTRKHDPTPVPFALGGSWVRGVVQRRMTEHDAADTDLVVNPGHELMEYFLRGGVR